MTVRERAPYGIVGGGRMARHLCHYLGLLGVPFHQWHRRTAARPEEALEPCETIVVLIRDDQIESWIESQAALSERTWVHFSGMLWSERAVGLHPLSTFGDRLRSLEAYRRIPFIGEHGRPGLEEIFPELDNPHRAIPPESKPLYHALCVLAGNGSAMLWRHFFKRLEGELGIPASMAAPYLEDTLNDLRETPFGRTTGPIGRGDGATLDADLAALASDPFARVFDALRDAASHSTESEP